MGAVHVSGKPLGLGFTRSLARRRPASRPAARGGTARHGAVGPPHPASWRSDRGAPARAAAAAAAAGAAADGGDATFARVVVPTALALCLCNMDRICLSVAMLPLAAEMGWAEGVQGVVQSAFLWGYLANQLAGGAAADRWGGKAVMAAGIAFFSAASALLPAAALSPGAVAAGAALPAALAARFLVGFGEGVALPSMSNLVATHIRPAARATALGAVFAGFQSGNLVGLLASPAVLQRWGWRALFYAFGALGAPLLALWLLAVPPRPAAAEAGGAGAAAAAARPPKPGVTLRALLGSRAVRAIVVANTVNHWGYFIYLNWMPTYFAKVHGADVRASALLSLGPWVAMAAGSSLSGLACDAAVARGARVVDVRRAAQAAAFLGPVAALAALAGAWGPLSAAAAGGCLTAALGLTSLGQFVTSMGDVAPAHAGRLFGLSNTFGSAAGIAGVAAAGFVVERTGSFAPVFAATAALNVLGAAVWLAHCSADKEFD